MIPVNEDVISPLNMRPSPGDTPAEAHYKKLTAKQLTFCQKNQNAIVKKANRLYELITAKKANHLLACRCSDFIKLEHVLEKYKKKD